MSNRLNHPPLHRAAATPIVVDGALLAVESRKDGCSSQSGSRPESHAAIFVPGFRPAHAPPMAGRPRIQHPKGEEGGSDFGRISNAPATMAAVESLCGGALQRLPKGFAMTNIPVPAARVRQLQTLCYILHTIYSAHAVGDYRLLAQLLSITVDIGDQAFEASNALGALMSKDGGAQ